MLNDPLANALSAILNAEKIGRKECEIRPISKVIKKVLSVMKDNLYIGDVQEVKDSKGGLIKVNLLGNINDCSAIKPRFSVKKDLYEKFEKRFLPAKGMGIIIVSTPQGIMTQADAKKKGLGCRLLSYCY
ncbi:30S ribosomal protein S8 [Candidatus Woesearchaeota archaeon]|nr:30S ribosomal protein S8 [Candidatus Woesearchaeota archaeon]